MDKAKIEMEKLACEHKRIFAIQNTDHGWVDWCGECGAVRRILVFHRKGFCHPDLKMRPWLAPGEPDCEQFLYPSRHINCEKMTGPY